jgi:hypothetical protein
LFFACFASAAINIGTSENAEIAGFIESESKKVLKFPEAATLDLNFQTAKDKHSRAGFLFFWGRREVLIEANYTLAMPNLDTLKGNVRADTSWLTGYCGMIECRTRPMPVQQRIEVLKSLVPRILTELNGKLYGVSLPPPSNLPNNAPPDAPPNAPAADSTVAE